jgi:hypothetical protein
MRASVRSPVSSGTAGVARYCTHVVRNEQSRTSLMNMRSAASESVDPQSFDHLHGAHFAETGPNDYQRCIAF